MAHEGFGTALFEDLHGARPRVEIIGNSRVVVENHRGIQEYDDGVLRVVTEEVTPLKECEKCRKN